MRGRTLVYAVVRENHIGLRTVSRFKKSPHRFYIFRNTLEELEYRSEIIVHDIRSFAVLRRNAHAGTMEIEFTWLGNEGNGVSGYQDTIVLPYDRLMECLRECERQGEPVTWKVLSIDNSAKRPQFVFRGRKNLHDVIENGTVRRKLIRFLRDQFNWPYSERIEFHDDFVPYSFVFQEIEGEKPVLTGGLILHRQEDLENAYYAIHT